MKRQECRRCAIDGLENLIGMASKIARASAGPTCVRDDEPDSVEFMDLDGIEWQTDPCCAHMWCDVVIGENVMVAWREENRDRHVGKEFLGEQPIVFVAPFGEITLHDQQLSSPAGRLFDGRTSTPHRVWNRALVVELASDAEPVEAQMDVGNGREPSSDRPHVLSGGELRQADGLSIFADDLGAVVAPRVEPIELNDCDTANG